MVQLRELGRLRSTASGSPFTMAKAALHLSHFSQGSAFLCLREMSHPEDE